MASEPRSRQGLGRSGHQGPLTFLHKPAATLESKQETAPLLCRPRCAESTGLSPVSFLNGGAEGRGGKALMEYSTAVLGLGTSP